MRCALRPLAALVAAVVLVGLLPAVRVGARGPVQVVAREVSTSVEHERVVQLPIPASHVALHWRGVPEAKVDVAFSTDGATFGARLDVARDEVGEQRGDGETYGAVFAADGANFVRVTSDRPIRRLTVLALDSTAGSGAPSIGFDVGFGAVTAAAVSQPAVISRAGWSADESLRFDATGNEIWPAVFQPIQKLIVHHTATRNGDPDPAATIRSIYYYHAVTQGWGDIGYNFLIDEAGQVYEGRYSRTYLGESPTAEDVNGNGVTGAHALGFNSGTVGIALLGTLTSQDATPAARDAVERILAWKADRHAIDPHGNSLYTNPVNGTQKTFPNIAGHRDVNATECPGGVFYATLPALRDAVAARINAGGGTKATVPSAPTLAASQPKPGKGTDLTWTRPPDGGSAITGYRIYRAIGSGSTALLATVSAATTTYRDGTVQRRMTYTYTLRATNAVGEGPSSNAVSVTTR